MMNTCIECPNLKFGKWCELMDDPEEPGEPRIVEDALVAPPDWCPLRREETTYDEYLEIYFEDE